MRRVKPYYRFLNSVMVAVDEECSRCSSFERIRECWVEDGGGVVPDDYRYILHCVCEDEGEFAVEE